MHSALIFAVKANIGNVSVTYIIYIKKDNLGRSWNLIFSLISFIMCKGKCSWFLRRCCWYQRSTPQSPIVCYMS